MQAVILAAGLGSRLKDKTKEMPKGFIEIDGLAIVERSIKKLIEHGIAEIIIGTGHCSNYYDALAKKYPNITTVFNADFANTSSMATLNLCASFIKGNFLLLESDLIYDDIGLFVLINDKRNDVVLLSSKTNSGDEVYVEADEKSKLLNVSKDINKVKPYGELVGISKLTPEALDAMRRYFLQGKNPHMDYETAMAQVSSLGGHAIFVEKIENYCWCEIDDENHLERAKKEIQPKILNGERLRKVKREILLNPGPATTTDSVKYAQVCADICPREKEFGDVLAQTALELSKMGGDSDQTETVLLGGSGTAADEAMISSCMAENSKLLIIDNGAYGRRLAQIAEIYNLDFEVYSSSGFLPLDVDAVKKLLACKKFTHLAMVYHETTTGLLNPVNEICRFAKQNNIVTLIDAVSAFAAYDINLKRDGIDFMSSAANKNIGGMAGISFVICQRESLEKISRYPKRSFYLNLWDQYDYFKKSHQMRFTPPVQTIYALRQAIIETKVETIAGRFKRFCACWDVLRQTLEKLNLKMLVPVEAQSKLITAIVEPQNPKYNFEALHDYCIRAGFTIYPGKISSANTFRIANIGDIQVYEMQNFCEVLTQYMRSL